MLPEPGRLRMAVYDIRGRLVRTLVDEHRPRGVGKVVWDGCDRNGQACGSGLYLCRTVCGDLRDVQKLTLVR